MAEPLRQYLIEANDRVPSWLKSMAKDGQGLAPQTVEHPPPVHNRFLQRRLEVGDFDLIEMYSR